jgi:hypothetical protein
MCFDNTCKRAFVCDRQGGITQMYRLLHQFGRVRCASEETVVTEAVELGVGHIKNTVFLYSIITLAINPTSIQLSVILATESSSEGSSRHV